MCTLLEGAMKKCNMFGYGEVNQYNAIVHLMSAYKKYKDEKTLDTIF